MGALKGLQAFGDSYRVRPADWQKSRVYQKLQAPFQTTQRPSSKLVIAWAVIASPSRFLRMTSHW